MQEDDKPAASKPEQQVRVVTCGTCDAPVAHTAGMCPTCRAPLTGKEFPYIPRRDSSGPPDIRRTAMWWLGWVVLIWALNGFTLGQGPDGEGSQGAWFAIVAISMFFLIRVWRGYFK